MEKGFYKFVRLVPLILVLIVACWILSQYQHCSCSPSHGSQSVATCPSPPACAKCKMSKLCTTPKPPKPPKPSKPKTKVVHVKEFSYCPSPKPNYNGTLGKPNMTVEEHFCEKYKLMRDFQPIITQAEKEQFITYLEAVTNELDRLNITYFMFGGTMIGSWRHQDLVPWDDDIDISINYSDHKAILALSVSGYSIDPRRKIRYKFLSNDAKPIPGLSYWSWPYIDLCFFVDNGTHIYDKDPIKKKANTYKRDDVFPLTRRPLGRLMLRSPRNPMGVVREASHECQTRSYNHKEEKMIRVADLTTVDCRALYFMYPFVIRNNSDTSPNKTEKLYHDGNLIRKVTLPIT